MLFGIIAHTYKQEQAHKFAFMCLDMFALISEGVFKRSVHGDTCL